MQCQFLQDVSKIDEKQVSQELERRSTLENRNWNDRSSRSTTTTPLGIRTQVDSGESRMLTTRLHMLYVVQNFKIYCESDTKKKSKVGQKFVTFEGYYTPCVYSCGRILIVDDHTIIQLDTQQSVFWQTVFWQTSTQ